MKDKSEFSKEVKAKAELAAERYVQELAIAFGLENKDSVKSLEIYRLPYLSGFLSGYFDALETINNLKI